MLYHAIPMKHEVLKIGVDVDDVLYLCNQHAIDMLCKDKEYAPLSINDISGWGSSGKNTMLDERIAYFSRADFVENQPLIPGAKEFIAKLCERGEVIFVTAVGGSCMTARAQRLLHDFPMVPERNIMIGARKDLLSLDVLLDDGAHNILGSHASYPVLFRKPWNNNLTGLLAVNTYDDFLRLIDQIIGYRQNREFSLKNGGVLCLVGPSGSGKSELTRSLMEDQVFCRPLTCTTRCRRESEPEEYHFVSRDSFQNGQANGRFLETTVYGGEYYGAERKAVDDVVNSGRIAVMPIDICGAISIKNAYPEQSALVFLQRGRSAVLRSILNRDCSEEEKVLRILSLDAEYRNEGICDIVLSMNQSIDDARADLMRKLGLSLFNITPSVRPFWN